jgi:hypothetical protein
MKKNRIYYDIRVGNHELPYWWQDGQKIPVHDDNLNCSKGFSNYRRFRTGKLADTAFRNCPNGAIMTQYFTKNSREVCKSWERIC